MNVSPWITRVACALFLLAGLGLAAQPAPAAPEAMPAFQDGPDAVAEHRTRMAALHEMLAKDAPKLGVALGGLPPDEQLERLRTRDQAHGASDGQPQAFLAGVSMDLFEPVDLSSLDTARLTKSGARDGSGFARLLDDGSLAWTARVQSPGASEISIVLEDLRLPDGVELYVYNGHGAVDGPYTGDGGLGTGSNWTAPLPGDELALEVRVPKDRLDPDGLAGVVFTIASVIHYGDGTLGGMRSGCASNAWCINSAECYGTGTFAHIEALRGSVAHIVYMVGGLSYVCSGNLVNSSTAPLTPYFLTANHCFSSQSVASSARFYWDYRKDFCNDFICWDRSWFPSQQGATLLHTSAAQDVTFLRLNANPPGARWFLGWTTSAVAFSANTRLYSIHHPNGEPQSYSEHTVNTTAGTCTGLPRGDFIYSNQALNSLEGGSSGAVAVIGTGQIVGQLFGFCGTAPNNACGNNRRVDGAFSRSFNALAQWLWYPIPSNDNFPGETIFGEFGYGLGTTLGASRQWGEPAHAGQGNSPSVWYTWTAPSRGLAVFTTCSYADYDTVMAAYRGNAVNALTWLDSNDDECDHSSALVFPVTAGSTYRIAVAGYGTQSGDFDLDWEIIPPPHPPAAQAASNITTTSFRANWATSSGATGYRLDVSTSPTFNNFLNGFNNRSVGNATSFVVTGLVPGTTYHYRVRATSDAGTSSNSSTVSVVTVPRAPAIQSAASVGSSGFRARWSSVPGASSYRVDVSTTSDFSSLVPGYSNRDAGNALFLDVTGLAPGVLYHYRARAVNASGAGPNSPSASVRTRPETPVLAGFSSVGANAFRVNWSPAAGATGYRLDVSTNAAFTAMVRYQANRDVGNGTSALVNGLAPGVRYHVRLRATNAGGASGNSDAESVVTLPNVPVARPATNVTDGSFRANWSAAAGATGYRLDVATDAAFTSLLPGAADLDVGTSLGILVTGLDPGTTYHYRVRAVNLGGTSGNSATILVRTRPLAPVLSGATELAPQAFTINWAPSPGATGYRLDVANNAAFTSFVSGQNNRDVGAGTSARAWGLQPGRSYHVRLRALSSGGASANSAPIVVTTLPAAPVARAATNVSSTAFRANWAAAAGATGYRLDVATDAAFTNIIPGLDDLDVGTALGFLVTGLDPGTTYRFRVRAMGAAGASPNSGTIAVTTAPPAPLVAAATSITATGFRANWDASPGAASYRLDVSTNPGFSNFVNGQNNRNVGAALGANVTGLAPGTTYHYRVRAVNAAGTSSNSATASLTTIPPAVASISYPTQNGTGTVAISWPAARGATTHELERSSNNGATWTPVFAGAGTSHADSVPSGSHRYRVRGRNDAGAGPWFAPNRACVVELLPFLTIIEPDGDVLLPAGETSVAFLGAATAVDGPLASVDWRLNGGPWTPAAGLDEWTLVAQPIPPGDNRVEVRSVSEAGLASEPAERIVARAFDAPTWRQLAGPQPPSRNDHALAHDSARGRTVPFGGWSGNALLGDTWEWDGFRWSRIDVPGPAARRAHSMAYDPTRGRVVLFGGRDNANALGDTWEWDGAAWSQVATTGPQPRAGHVLAHDPASGATLLFGGINGSTRLGDTWSWDGSAWTQVAASGPPARNLHAMASDLARGRVVLFGGMSGAARLRDTWEWDGAQWIPVASNAGPSGRQGHAMAFDPGRGLVLLHGGWTGSANLADLWQWDGAQWTASTAAGPAPSARRDHEMVHDDAMGRVVLLGGWTGGAPIAGTHVLWSGVEPPRREAGLLD